MAWTVNFKACKRCSSGEYWLVSSRFTNTVHPVAAGSPRVALQTLLEPWEGGEGSQNAGENSQQAKAVLSWLGAPACAWLPAQGRAGCRAELTAPLGFVALGSCRSSQLPALSPASPGSHRLGWIVKETVP